MIGSQEDAAGVIDDGARRTHFAVIEVKQRTVGVDPADTDNAVVHLELADETRSIIDESKISGEVHMEPAMMMNDRFEGHIVQGHVDCVGKVTSITPRENATDFIITVDKKYIAHIIPKGSITIDGISLTVNDVGADNFRLTIIPHTLKETLMRNYKVGTKLNIETDVFARYIDHILAHRSSKKSMSWDEIDNIQMTY